MSADMSALSLEHKLACFQADSLLAASLIQTSLAHLPRDGTATKDLARQHQLAINKMPYRHAHSQSDGELPSSQKYHVDKQD